MNRYQVVCRPIERPAVILEINAICHFDAVAIGREHVYRGITGILVDGKALTFAERSTLLSKLPCDVYRLA
jgi:hypothetical protein